MKTILLISATVIILSTPVFISAKKNNNQQYLPSQDSIKHKQIIYNFGPELGITISDAPFSKRHIINPPETIKPLVSHLIGFHGKLIIKNNFQLSAGIQYQMIGEQYYSYYDGFSLSRGEEYSIEIWENQKFHKLCLPFSIGYVFKACKIKPTIFLGYRPNFFISGKYYKKNVYDPNINKSGDDEIHEEEFNPLKLPEGREPVNRYNSIFRQYFCGFSVLLRQNFKLSLTYNFGYQIHYNCYSFHLALPNPCLINSDCFLTVTYLFKPSTKSTNKTDNSKS